MVYFGDSLVIRTLNIIGKPVPSTTATNDKLKSNNMAQPAASHTLVLSTLSFIIIRINKLVYKVCWGKLSLFGDVRNNVILHIEEFHYISANLEKY